MMHLLQISGLLAAIPIGGAMYFAAYTLFKKKHRPGVFWSGLIGAGLIYGVVLYFLEPARYLLLFSIPGTIGFSFGKSKAMEKHPEAFALPKKEEI